MISRSIFTILTVVIFLFACSGVARRGANILTREAAATETHTALRKFEQEALRTMVKNEPSVPIYPIKTVNEPGKPVGVITPGDLDNRWRSVMDARSSKAGDFNITPGSGTPVNPLNVTLTTNSFNPQLIKHFGKLQGCEIKWDVPYPSIHFSNEYRYNSKPVRTYYEELMQQGFELELCMEIDNEGKIKFNISASSKGELAFKVSFDSEEGFGIYAEFTRTNGDELDQRANLKLVPASYSKTSEQYKVETNFCYPVQNSQVSFITPSGTRSYSINSMSVEL